MGKNSIMAGSLLNVTSLKKGKNMAKTGMQRKPHNCFADEQSNNAHGHAGNYKIYSTYMLFVRDALAKIYQKLFGST